MAKLSKEAIDFIVDNFERYLYLLDFMIILNRCPAKDYKKAKKKAHKVLKKLKEGDTSVLAPEVLEHYRDDYERLAHQRHAYESGGLYGDD